MNKEQRVCLLINGGVSKTESSRHLVSGKVTFNSASPSNEQHSLRATLSIPKANLKPTAQTVIVNLLNKTLGLQSKNNMLPTSLYELLKNEHLKCEVKETSETVDVVFSSLGPLEKAVAYFIGNLLSKGSFEADNNQKIDFALRSQTPFMTAVKNYCQNDKFDSFFPFLLTNSEFDLQASLSAETGALLDSLANVIAGKSVFPLFSFAQECDVSLSIDYASPNDEFNYWHAFKTTDTLFFDWLNDIFNAIVHHFQGLSEDELKTLAKLLDFLSREGQSLRPLGFSLEFDKFGRIDVHLPLEEFSSLFEFLMYHPVTTDKEKIKRYKEQFLGRVAVTQNGSPLDGRRVSQ